MGATLPHSVSAGQPHPVGAGAYRFRMEEEFLREVVSSNVKALLMRNARKSGATPSAPGVSMLVNMGFANGTAQRILAGDTSFGVDLLARLATRLGVEPWQLLVPNIDAENLPELSESPGAWPFDMVERRRYDALALKDRVFVQSKLDSAIQEREDANRKRRPQSESSASG